MTIEELTKLMNDEGTKPNIAVLDMCEDYNLLIYEGNPDKADKEISERTVNSFTVLGRGFLKIYATKRGGQ